MSAAVRQHAQSLVKDFSSHDVAVSEEASSAATVEEINRCLVFCRVRPSIPKDYEDGAFQLVTVDKKRVIVKDERHYDFDGTFDQNCQQEDVFAQVAVPCLQHACKGFCSALMCYGQTGTGKSFTMCCTKPGSEGIIPRAAKFIFDKINSDPSRMYKVTGQFIQIYRDHLGDLMSESGREKVDIRFEAGDGVTLQECSSHTLTSEAEFMAFYHEGNQRRVVTATAMNPESSRGHTAMIVLITSEPVNDPCGGKVRGKITFIDLAGYERFSKTGISNANPIMKDEAKTINGSLLSLGHVVSSLSNGDKHIPWRNAKLTRLLQDSIGGRSRTSIILTVGPSSDHLHETTNSLQFGMRAMAVKVEAKVTVTVDYEKLAAKLQAMLEERNERIGLLEVQIASQDAERAELLERHQRDGELIREEWQAERARLIREDASEERLKKLDTVYKSILDNLKEQQQLEVDLKNEAFNKEMVNLVHEQQRQEQRRQAEMKLAQERIIEDFQTKLEGARGGTNEDLIKAIQQLGEKDAILASRANDTARLHAEIERLRSHIRELGGELVHETDFPETFLDVSQVDELTDTLKGELARVHEKVVDLKAQLQANTELCTDRLQQVSQLQEENSRLRLELSNAGISAQQTELELARLEQTRGKLVDRNELETLRVTMQADIDELRSRNASLEEELAKLREQAKEAQSTVPLTARVRGLSITARGRPPSVAAAAASALSAGPEGSARAAGNEGGHHYKEQLEQLQTRILHGDQERSTLCQRIADLENLLVENGIECNENDSLIPAPPNQDVLAILKVKDMEIDSLTDMVQRLEQQCQSERAARALVDSLNHRLDQQLRALGHASTQQHKDDDVTPPPPAPTIPLDVYISLLRKLHGGSAKVCCRLAVRKFEDEPEGIDTVLQEKEDEVQLLEEDVLAKTAKCEELVRLVDRLEQQLDHLGIAPVCRLGDDYRATLNQEKEEMEFAKARQRQLEEDRKKLQNVLESLKADRAHSVMDRSKMEEELQEAKQRAKEMEEQQRLLAEREQMLEQQTRLATRQMMDAQAKAAAAENQNSLFSRFKRLLN